MARLSYGRRLLRRGISFTHDRCGRLEQFYNSFWSNSRIAESGSDWHHLVRRYLIAAWAAKLPKRSGGLDYRIKHIDGPHEFTARENRFVGWRLIAAW